MESIAWKLTSPYIKYRERTEFAVWLRKLKRGLCIYLEGWGGEGEDIYIPMPDSCRGLTENNKIL